MADTNVSEVQVYRSDEDGEWYWRAVAGNERIVAVSGEGFTRKEDAVRAFVDVFPGVPGFMSHPRTLLVDEHGRPAEPE